MRRGNRQRQNGAERDWCLKGLRRLFGLNQRRRKKDRISPYGAADFKMGADRGGARLCAHNLAGSHCHCSIAAGGAVVSNVGDPVRASSRMVGAASQTSRSMIPDRNGQ